MAHDPVEEWLLSVMNDPKVQLRWRTECAALLLDHQRRRGWTEAKPVELNVKVIIQGLDGVTASVEHQPATNQSASDGQSTLPKVGEPRIPFLEDHGPRRLN
jgi:hypothetical protein